MDGLRPCRWSELEDWSDDVATAAGLGAPMRALFDAPLNAVADTSVGGTSDGWLTEIANLTHAKADRVDTLPRWPRPDEEQEKQGGGRARCRRL